MPLPVNAIYVDQSPLNELTFDIKISDYSLDTFYNLKRNMSDRQYGKLLREVLLATDLGNWLENEGRGKFGTGKGFTRLPVKTGELFSWSGLIITFSDKGVAALFKMRWDKQRIPLPKL